MDARRDRRRIPSIPHDRARYNFPIPLRMRQKYGRQKNAETASASA